MRSRPLLLELQRPVAEKRPGRAEGCVLVSLVLQVLQAEMGQSATRAVLDILRIAVTDPHFREMHVLSIIEDKLSQRWTFPGS